ncbi:DUF998 domain-containing protein [Antrihabitans sp. YC3-6]|uniref:DUF998 domain-containing protein n=1 Tax=Antrihabitans stalagmiti TaxID=2799499 RepID=A0A934NRG4_9NOCA|nr:DUF998 domain-containing protein [Antrihabitans stalagmiti]MBJ8339964.1 DUF998 domain-containing protein [Antrihabitans stalagmiti]
MTLSVRERIGAVAWILIAGYFVAEAVVVAALPKTYNAATSSISSLGEIHCTGDICSPLPDLMNWAFMVTGILVAVGAFGLKNLLPPGRRSNIVLALLAVTAISCTATGFVPIDTDESLHQIVAIPTFIARNAALALLIRPIYTQWRHFGILTAAACVTGTLGTLAIVVTDLPFGVVERVALYPFSVWAVVAGVAASVMSSSARPLTPARQPTAPG